MIRMRTYAGDMWNLISGRSNNLLEKRFMKKCSVLLIVKRTQSFLIVIIYHCVSLEFINNITNHSSEHLNLILL